MGQDYSTKMSEAQWWASHPHSCQNDSSNFWFPCFHFVSTLPTVSVKNQVRWCHTHFKPSVASLILKIKGKLLSLTLISFWPSPQFHFLYFSHHSPYFGCTDLYSSMKWKACYCLGAFAMSLLGVSFLHKYRWFNSLILSGVCLNITSSEKPSSPILSM